MARRKKGNPIHGWVVFDKPLGMTSTQAVGKIRWLFQAQKAGHGGTLDPLATGILPIALGNATKTVPFIKWGENRDTLDAEGKIIATSDVRPVRADIEAALPEFIGEISQIPPKYSAIKIDGKRAYDLARSGEEVTLKARPVRIDSLEILECGADSVTLRMRCGKGTYVRSLARDLAARLGTCGYVSYLRRTQVGPFEEIYAFSLDDLEYLCHRGRVLEALAPVQAVLDDIPVQNVTETDRQNLKQGRAIAASVFYELSEIGDEPFWVLAVKDDVAIALCHLRGGQLWPKRVFNV